MSAKFHIALLCSSASYDARKLFYTEVFRAPPVEGEINDGSEGHQYWGSCWDCENGYLFALLKDPTLVDAEEKLAHIGFFFDNCKEFDAEVQKRNINTPVKVYPDGKTKQVFKKDESGVEWEFAFKPSDSGS